MNALIIVAAILISVLAAPSPPGTGVGKTTKYTRNAMVPQPPKRSFGVGTGKNKNVAVNPTHPGVGTLTKCKKNGKKCLKPNAKFVMP